ncbi:hypothetical protein SLA2020_477150 [Shorea laevis]
MDALTLPYIGEFKKVSDLLELSNEAFNVENQNSNLEEVEGNFKENVGMVQLDSESRSLEDGVGIESSFVVETPSHRENLIL